MQRSPKGHESTKSIMKLARMEMVPNAGEESSLRCLKMKPSWTWRDGKTKRKLRNDRKDGRGEYDEE